MLIIRRFFQILKMKEGRLGVLIVLLGIAAILLLGKLNSTGALSTHPLLMYVPAFFSFIGLRLVAGAAAMAAEEEKKNSDIGNNEKK